MEDGGDGDGAGPVTPMGPVGAGAEARTRHPHTIMSAGFRNAPDPRRPHAYAGRSGRAWSASPESRPSWIAFQPEASREPTRGTSRSPVARSQTSSAAITRIECPGARISRPSAVNVDGRRPIVSAPHHHTAVRYRGHVPWNVRRWMDGRTIVSSSDRTVSPANRVSFGTGVHGTSAPSGRTGCPYTRRSLKRANWRKQFWKQRGNTWKHVKRVGDQQLDPARRPL